MLNLCGIVVAILKMAIGRNFSMSAINSGHHYLPTYKILMISDNVEYLRIVASILKMVTGRNFSMSGHHYLPTCFGSHFENGRHLENFENAELLL